MQRREIRDWQEAQSQWEDPAYPRTHPLQLVYKDALLDTHLHAATQNRLMRITQKQFVIQNEGGEKDDKLSPILQQEWFAQLVGYALEATFYGYSLVQMRMVEGMPRVRNLPRTHIIPQTQQLVQDYTSDVRGIDFTAHPHQLLFAQREQDGKGLLEKVVPLTILKRHAIGSWGAYTQIFGVPLRIAKVPNVSGKATDDTARWLEQMGSAAYAIFPTGSDIEIKESGQHDAHKVFEQFIKLADSQISKLVNGQTMTMDDGASLSQSQVHAQTEGQITKADLRWLIGWGNRTLLPALRHHGLPITAQHRLAVEEVTMPSEKIRIDQVLLQSGVRLSKEYLENTYGVEVEDAPADPQKKRAKAQNRLVSDDLLALYAPVAYAWQDETSSFAVPVEAWLRKIFAGTQKTVDGKSARAVMDYLAQAVDKGYGKTIVSLPFGEQAHTLFAELQYNAGTLRRPQKPCPDARTRTTTQRRTRQAA